ncbi:alpha/beta hydrolase [Mycolicibacterium sp. 018/SC-01/001]|uniref:alpha/beta hydrolase n=1 Tax=Mycolicibacterium sp. 018/SC-01/001 TaxID=2592069 RepID=UPI0011806759|nr:alpha/beta hydrolase [Mycolicibacterium sp. 018/SC-01/001]TRW77904.1 alpha/beta hydrolase [Mycolicibacterium sp. 018/SC-01/001]
MNRRTTAAVTLGVLAAPMAAALFTGIGVAAAEPDSRTDRAAVSAPKEPGPRAETSPRVRRGDQSDTEQRRPRSLTPRHTRDDKADATATDEASRPAPRRVPRHARQTPPREVGEAPVHETATSTADDNVVAVDRASPRSRSAERSVSRAETLRPAAAPSVATRVRIDDNGPVPAPPRRAGLLNVVGSLVLNTLVGLIHLVDGPPALPPNSTVTVRTSRLELPIGAGRSVQADWYFPDDADTSTRLIYFQHGFLASGPMYSYTIAHLAERTDSIIVAPSLSSNFFSPSAEWVGGSTIQRAVADLFVGDRAALAESASAAAGYDVTLPQAFVLVGHSAGGTLVTSVAGYLADNGAISDLRGIVMLDGVEPAGSPFVTNALSKLQGANYRPIYLISSDRYFWSRNGDMADKLQLARPDDFNGVNLVGGRHIDYMLGGNKFLQFAEYLTAGFSKPQNIDAAEILTAGWVNDLFAGTASQGIYGAPGQDIAISTPAGTADAVVLPLGYPARPVWPPVLEAVLTAIFDFAGRNWFVYEPVPGHEVPVGSPGEIEQQSFSGA